jgi:hypothetical protein
MTQIILQNDRPAAVVGARQIFLAPHIADFPLTHPVRRYVAAKVVYALDVAEGLRRGPYSDEEADRWARRIVADLCPAGRRRRWGMPVA